MNKRKSITVAVTGLNAIDNPGPGIPVIRCIKESKIFNSKIIGLAYESLEPGIFMHDLIDKTYQIPYPSAGMEVLFERIKHVNSIEKIDVIIPNFDAELYSFIKLKDRLEEIGIKTFLPTIEQFEERHKVNLNSFGDKYGIKVPASHTINSPNEFYKLPSNINFPIAVKGKYYDASIASNIEQAQQYFNKIANKWGLPIIIQEFIDGQELNVTGLGDGNGELISYVSMRKQYITDKGKAWAGVSIEDDNLKNITQNFINKTKWRGAFELEIIKKKDTNDYYLLEINPRIPAWIYLSFGVGNNIPEMLLKLCIGEKVSPSLHYKTGKMFVRYSYDMIVDIEELEQISTLGEL